MFVVKALPMDFKAFIGEPQFDKEIAEEHKGNGRNSLYDVLSPLLP